MFSALRWREILNDWAEYKLDFHTSLVLNQPVSVKYLPRELSSKALTDMQWCIDNIGDYYTASHQIEKFIEHTENCMNYIRGCNNQFDKFADAVIKYIKFCDTTSGNSYRDYYPELVGYMNDNTT